MIERRLSGLVCYDKPSLTSSIFFLRLMLCFGRKAQKLQRNDFAHLLKTFENILDRLNPKCSGSHASFSNWILWTECNVHEDSYLRVYLDEVVGEGDACRSIEDRTVRVGDEVGRHNGLLGVTQHSRHGALGRLWVSCNGMKLEKPRRWVITVNHYRCFQKTKICHGPIKKAENDDGVYYYCSNGQYVSY